MIAPDQVFAVREDLLVDDDELASLLKEAPVRRAWPAAAASIIDRKVQFIVEQCDPLAIILFGSRARGTARLDSDVDLLIIVPSIEDRLQLITAVRCSLADAPLAKDIFVATPAQITVDRHIPFTIAEAAYREGRLLYERRGADTEDLELASLCPARSRPRQSSAEDAG